MTWYYAGFLLSAASAYMLFLYLLWREVVNERLERTRRIDTLLDGMNAKARRNEPVDSTE